MDNLPIKKQKILYFVTKSNWGGAQRHVFDLATNIPKEKFDVVVAFGGNGTLSEKLNTSQIRTISIDSLERDIHIFKELSSFLTIYKIIRNEKPDIVHLHSTKAGGLGALATRLYNLSSSLGANSQKLKAKVVFTVHGWAHKEDRKNWQRKILYFVSWLTTLLCHKVIVVSEDDKNKSPTLFVKNKIVLIHNGIESFKTISKTEARAKIFGSTVIGKKTLILGSISELHKNKGLSYAIQAISDIKSREADKDNPIIYGIISDGEERKNLETLIEKNNLKDSVFLAGQIDNAKTYLSAFDLFILPSIKEGLPYVILEAGSIGIPVISSNVGGTSEIIKDMETGILIRPGETKEIDYALRFFIQNPEKISEFGGKLKKRISEEFSLEKMLEKTIAVYENR